MDRQPAVYILSNRPYGTLYVGVTSDLRARVWQHRNDVVEGFTRRHRIHRLVWYEIHSSMYSAITKEKQLKRWKRSWKILLVQRSNPDWRDLWSEIL